MSWAQNQVDWQAVDHESNKHLARLDTAAIEYQYELFEAAQAFSDGDDPVILGDNYYFFDDDDSDKDDAQPSNLEDAENKIQDHILENILLFKKENKLYEKNTKEIINNYLKITQEKKGEVLPSDIANLIANFLRSKNEYDLAIKFYNLAAETNRSAGEEYLAVGDMLVSYFNDQITEKKPKHPSSELFHAVRRAIIYYRNGSGACEIGDFFADALTKIRDMMVRWPVSPQSLRVDNFYTYGYLLEKIYEIGFVDSLLADIRKFNKIFKSYKYDPSQNDGNLLNSLYEAGFYGIKKGYGNNPQYVWVNPQGYIVRIKYNANAKPRAAWEFSVGITFINPFEWRNNKAVKNNKHIDQNAKAPFYQRLAQYDDLASNEFNEIFKIVVDDKLVMIIPARMNNYWFGNFSERIRIMNQAHKHILPVKKVAELDTYCGFALND